MAKFELKTYDTEDNVKNVYKRNKCSVEQFLKFQQFSEKVTSDNIQDDKEFFAGLKKLFLEFFPDLTEDEYKNNTDVAEVIVLFNEIVKKATQFTIEKNV